MTVRSEHGQADVRGAHDLAADPGVTTDAAVTRFCLLLSLMVASCHFSGLAGLAGKTCSSAERLAPLGSGLGHSRMFAATWADHCLSIPHDLDAGRLGDA